MMKPYMGFSRTAGAHNGAILIFAHTAREARAVGWKEFGRELTDEFTYFAVRRMWKAPWLFKDADRSKILRDKPHFIDAPTSCERCEKWGFEIIDGVCSECRKEEAADGE